MMIQHIGNKLQVEIDAGRNPLSYIKLADTPFLHSLRQQPLLQSWGTDRGDFHQRYFSQVLRDHKNLLGE